MNRRHFMLGSLGAGTLLFGGSTAFLYARRENSRSTLHSDLLREVRDLGTKTLDEIDTIVVDAESEMLRCFDLIGLNGGEFANRLFSPSFLQQLARCSGPAARESLLTVTFCEEVVRPEELLKLVNDITGKAGHQLDLKWHWHCRQLSAKWNIQLKDRGGIEADDLSTRLEGPIRREINLALQTAKDTKQPVALTETLKEVGKSALMLLPYLRYMRGGKAGIALGVFLFLANAATPIWNYVESRFTETERREEAIRTVTRQIAQLGKRVAAEFVIETQKRIADLRRWQDQAVCQIAEELSTERVGLI